GRSWRNCAIRRGQDFMQRVESLRIVDGFCDAFAVAEGGSGQAIQRRVECLEVQVVVARAQLGNALDIAALLAQLTEVLRLGGALRSAQALRFVLGHLCSQRLGLRRLGDYFGRTRSGTEGVAVEELAVQVRLGLVSRADESRPLVAGGRVAT